MSKHDKLLERVESGTADAKIPFDGMCSLLTHLGFGSRQRKSSHRIFFRGDVPEIINLQPNSEGKVKSYQVKQVRDILRKYPR